MFAFIHLIFDVLKQLRKSWNLSNEFKRNINVKVQIRNQRVLGR